MFNKRNVLVVIPARSGSKGIKNKNIQLINRKPLIYYTIKYSLKSKVVDKVVVSTDSKKYANIAKKFKAHVPFLRSKKLSGHSVPDYPVIKDALLKSEKFFKKTFYYIILMRPTSPFREKNLIERSLKIMEDKKKCSSVRAVKETPAHPYRNWISKKDGYIYGFVNKVYEPYNLERQKLPKIFFQTGDIETIKRETIMKGSISGKNVAPIILKEDFIDIDNLKDLELAKRKSEK